MTFSNALKKVICLYIATVVLMFCSCDLFKPDNTFELEELPDIGEFEVKAKETFFDSALDRMVASPDFGEIVPYAGNCTTYYYPGHSVVMGDNYSTTQFKYGIMTKDKRIITDAVYDDITWDKDYYVLSYVKKDGDVDCKDHTITTKTGDKVWDIPIESSYIQYVSNDTFCLMESNEYVLWNLNEGETYRADENANLIGCENGRFILQTWEGEDMTEKLTLIDFWGNELCGPYQSLTELGNDLYAFSKNGRFGIVNGDGKVVLSNRYLYVGKIGERYMAYKDGIVFFIDEKGKIDSKISVDNYYEGDFYMYSEGPGLIRINNDIYDLSGNKLDYDEVDYYYSFDNSDVGMYIMHKDSTTIFQDMDFNTLASFDEFYSCYAFLSDYSACALWKDGDDFSDLYNLNTKEIIMKNANLLDSHLIYTSMFLPTDEGDYNPIYDLYVIPSMDFVGEFRSMDIGYTQSFDEQFLALYDGYKCITYDSDLNEIMSVTIGGNQ